jgi:hypothetical protein
MATGVEIVAWESMIRGHRQFQYKDGLNMSIR